MYQKYSIGTVSYTHLDTTSYGHNIELIWLLNRAYEVLGLPPAREFTRKFADYTLANGWDNIHGLSLIHIQMCIRDRDEDVLSYALFPNVAKEFFQYREAQQKKVDAAVADKENKAYPV